MRSSKGCHWSLFHMLTNWNCYRSSVNLLPINIKYATISCWTCYRLSINLQSSLNLLPIVIEPTIGRHWTCYWLPLNLLPIITELFTGQHSNLLPVSTNLVGDPHYYRMSSLNLLPAIIELVTNHSWTSYQLLLDLLSIDDVVGHQWISY